MTATRGPWRQARNSFQAEVSILLSFFLNLICSPSKGNPDSLWKIWESKIGEEKTSPIPST